jgi:ParB-like chromosome segregation protein Spo0J
MNEAASAARDEAKQAVSLVVDEEFAALIPPMSTDEFEELERSILAEGCRDPIVVWRGVIVDGHTRYRICQAHHLPFMTKEMEFSDRDEAKAWIIGTQLGRRNINLFVKAELASALKNLVAERAKENMRLGRGNRVDTPIHTREELAKKAGVSHNTISQVDRIKAKGVPELVKAARGNEVSVSMAVQVCEFEEAEQEALIASLPNEKKLAGKVKAMRKDKDRKAREERLAAQRNTGKSQGIGYKADALDWLPTIPDGSVDLLLTDPPYSTDIEDIEAFAASWVPLALSKVKDTGRCYIFVGAYPREIAAYEHVLKQYDTFERSLLAWSYQNTIGRRPLKEYVLNFQMIFYLWGRNAPDLDATSLTEQFAHHEINAPDARTGVRYHAWEKPYAIGDMFVRHATREGDFVIDPFMGTGTFIVAAANLNRVARGCDINAEALGSAKTKGCLIR